MAKKLVIVESPSKSKTIEKYLGSDYQVLSSVGHIRDLSTSGKGRLGIDIENGFVPHYVVSKEKKKVVTELKKASKGKQVYLATDPDREGEAISWHLMKILELDEQDTNRVVFNEITKDAVINAFDKPRKIDFDLVSSQETRRMLDRIIGFKLSSLLRSKIKSQSAGRVQSVALKLICERQDEIDAFVPEEYYTIDAILKHKDGNLDVSLAKYKGKKIELKTLEEANDVINNLSDEYKVKEIKAKKVNASAKSPFITSTLQQEASSKIGFNARKTMSVAQSLYEGIELDNETTGLITYMRTDSYRLSNEFVDSTFKYIKDTYGDEYVGKYAVKKGKGNVQDAHEAIRPTTITRTPESIKKNLTNDQFKLYELIYARALASLMSPGVKKTTSIVLNNNDYDFTCSGSIQVFDGYRKVYAKFEKSEEKIVPELKVDEVLLKDNVIANQHFTKGPSSYNESSLIKELEELKIGRPSTYSSIIETLKYRQYVTYEQKKFAPTEQGVLTNKKLEEFFESIINVKYTADMEDDLDKISEGQLDSVKVLTEFYNKFEPLLDKAKEDMEKIEPTPTGEKCPECGNDLVYRKGRFGTFVACSNYPECKYIKKEPKKPLEKTGEVCPQCGSDMVKRFSAKRNSEFEACSNFPKCKYIKPVEDEIVENEECPTCGKQIVLREGRYGKFKCCIDYPKCKTIIKE